VEHRWDNRETTCDVPVGPAAERDGPLLLGAATPVAIIPDLEDGGGSDALGTALRLLFWVGLLPRAGVLLAPLAVETKGRERA
jgi:hypothetical protein